jgi:hypothetical protein
VHSQIEPRGVQYSLVIVVQLHPLFITKVDKAYHVQCFYMEADKLVTSGLEVRCVAYMHSECGRTRVQSTTNRDAHLGRPRNARVHVHTARRLTEWRTRTLCAYWRQSVAQMGMPVRYECCVTSARTLTLHRFVRNVGAQLFCAGPSGQSYSRARRERVGTRTHMYCDAFTRTGAVSTGTSCKHHSTATI